MTRRAPFAAVFGAVLIALLFGCSAVSKTPSVPPKHPEELAAGRAALRDMRSGEQAAVALDEAAEELHSRLRGAG